MGGIARSIIFWLCVQSQTKNRSYFPLNSKMTSFFFASLNIKIYRFSFLELLEYKCAVVDEKQDFLSKS